jgi:PAS domain S-box-containing protein
MKPTPDPSSDDRIRQTSPLVWEAFDQAPALIAVVGGPEHVFEYANRAYRDFVGNRRLIGLPAREALPEYEGQGFLDLLDGVRSTGDPYVGAEAPLLVRRTPEGPLEQRFVDFVYQPLTGSDGTISGILAQGIDATARVLAHQTLAEREERYRTLFATIDEGFCHCEMIVDAAGRPVDYRFLEVNPAFAKMTGLPEHAAGHTARELVPGLEDHWIERYGRVGLGREPLRVEEGSEAMGQWFNVYAAPVGTPDSGQFVVVFSDVTDRKRSEQKVRDLNAALEDRVEKRTAEVRQLAARLTVAEQEERERIAQILHDDLQQRLFGASMVLQLLHRASGSEVVEGLVAKAAGILDEAVETTRTLVTELSPTILQSDRLHDLIGWVVAEKWRKYELAVTTEVRGEPAVPTLAYRVLLYQSVCEVLFNVVKHAGVAQAQLTAWEDAGEVVVEVTDGGAGFDPVMVARGRMTGFGLSSIHERLRLVGGRFEVDSAPGEGTRVTLSVPSGSEAPRLPKGGPSVDVLEDATGGA